MGVFLAERTKAVLAERQREARRLVPPSVETGRDVVRVRPGAAITTRSDGFVGNPSLTGQLAGWTIVKGDTPSEMQANGIQARLIGFERHPVVYACTKLVTDLVAAVPFEVYRKQTGRETKNRGSTDDVVLLPNSPAQKLLNSPWFSLSPHRIRQLMGVHFTLYGNWFAALIRGGEDQRKMDGSDLTLNGPPELMRLVHPERLLYVYLDAVTEEPILYDWRDRYGYRHRTPAVNMLHCADSTATDWIFGYPRAAAALLDIQTDNEASTYVRQVVHNDGTAGTVFLLEELISDDQAQTLKERYYQRNAERGQRGRTAFLGGVKDVKAVGFTLKDLEFPNLRQVAREDICAAFGVDARMVGVSSATGSKEGGLSGKQFLEARFRLIQETVLPMMRVIESYLDTWLLPEFGSDVYCRFSREALAALTEDETETWTRTTAAFAASLLTREEARSYLGQPDKPDDTDTLFVPSLGSLVPVANQFDAIEQRQQESDARVKQLQQGPNVGQLGPGKKEPDVGGEETAKNAGAGGAGAADTDGKPAANKPAEKRVITSTPGSPSGAEVLQPLGQQGRSRALLRYVSTPVIRGGVLTKEQRAAAWDVMQAKAESHEPKMQHAATMQFERDRSACSRAIRAAAHRARPAIPDHEYQAALRAIESMFAAPDGSAIGDWESLFHPLIGEAVGTGGRGVAQAVGSVWDVSNPQVALAINRRAQQLAVNVGQTTADQATAALRLAWSAGMSMSEAADLVESTAFGETMTSTRAQRIARTESIGALNEGEYRAAQLSGVITHKEWLTQQDDRVRDSHAELDGVVIGLDEVFDNGCDHPGDENGDPDEVINCRCTLLYHSDGDDTDTDDGDSGDDQTVDPDQPDDEDPDDGDA